MAHGGRTFPTLERQELRDERAVAVLGDVPIGERIDPATAGGRITTAVVDDISSNGVARVVLEGESASQEAHSLVRFSSASAASEALLGGTVLVLLNPGSQPVILGSITQRVWAEGETNDAVEVEATLPTGQPVTAQVDKRRLELEATDEIRLTCGRSSMVLRRDGTVIIRGVKVMSRASESNKIRGATVSIN